MNLAMNKGGRYDNERESEYIKDYSDVLTLSSLFKGEPLYGSVTEDYVDLRAQRVQVMKNLTALQTPKSTPARRSQELLQACDVSPFSPSSKQQQVKADEDIKRSISRDVIDLEDPKELENKTGKDVATAIVVDSDDDDGSCHVQNMLPFSPERSRDFKSWLSSLMELRLRKNKLSAGTATSSLQVAQEQGTANIDHALAIEGKKPPSIQYEKVVLRNVTDGQLAPDLENQRLAGIRGKRQGEAITSVANVHKRRRLEVARAGREGNALSVQINTEKENDVGLSPMFEDDLDCAPRVTSHQDDEETSESEGLDDLWKDMSVAMECSRGAAPINESNAVQEEEEEEEEDCNHSFMLEDDFGLVCRVCGVIQKRIETIFDYQWSKGTRSTRTSMPTSRNSTLGEIAGCSETKISEHFLVAADISIHPRHLKQMKPHQIEGFNFLVKNLLGNPPGGCILAHAPGSGKTFMLISFIQSFMAKDPNARPLVVLPKGILAIWRKEFQRWQVEDIPLLDFYSAKADNRMQQLEILNAWQETRSILLSGYKQFANIICEGGNNKVTTLCQEKLLKVPTLLILDEGHTPRNDNTDMVESLSKVATPCKVVLSGTLFQNHVGEVFNILKLVRPNFMKTESSRSIIKRIMSQVHIPGGRRPNKGNLESYFCELVEETLRNDENFKRKSLVIQELRDMTRDVLHYYKGDFLDELPGLIDFTILLNLGAKQKEVIRKLGKLDKFKKSSVEKAIYIHPQLMELRENASGDKGTSINIRKVDAIVDSINVRDGAKAKFFLNLLAMAESSGEKLLVFSQYLLPLKFLERLVARLKGWRLGKEIFVIFGDSSPEDREMSMDQFNTSNDAKVFFGSIKACGEGISLVGASRIVILDVHLNPSVTRQAIGRAFRPGQMKKVYTYRLVAADSQEEEDHNTSFRKELISKMWFEWSEHFGHQDLILDSTEIGDSEDAFFENPSLGEDIKALYKR